MTDDLKVKIERGSMLLAEIRIKSASEIQCDVECSRDLPEQDLIICYRAFKNFVEYFNMIPNTGKITMLDCDEMK